MLHTILVDLPASADKTLMDFMENSIINISAYIL